MTEKILLFWKDKTGLKLLYRTTYSVILEGEIEIDVQKLVYVIQGRFKKKIIHRYRFKTAVRPWVKIFLS